MSLNDKLAAVVTARNARLAAQSSEKSAIDALFNATAPGDGIIAPGQFKADTDAVFKIVYANVNGQFVVLTEAD